MKIVISTAFALIVAATMFASRQTAPSTDNTIVLAQRFCPNGRC